ncbi:MAG: TIGR01212 family radical SAM protein [Anaeromicrobium sp.]|jgi:radical SAM protein (TIGR01212 family)|uniref:TIGR01212 family radical SAM protein n=1 Tax=Anaeromicrobium sp. TaxID=1929132 RepID=UPI0025E376A5|nr:TIGR01212 family radical SAM protein [Anaeromicrobium sp.]MCT4593089.1 TIGR01212 family radical SAM protein [Anaeromicrobium sp.]
MRWQDKRYHSLNYELRSVFNEKIGKVSLDGGFTCPNRDGTLSYGGCIFCSESGSGEFAGSRNVSIKKQVEDQKTLLGHKWKVNKYIAYFQNYTNTYDRVENLREKYYDALSCDGIVGLAIGTRPDCIDDGILDLLEEINEKTYLWVELGLQTIHDNTAHFINRGYELDIFNKTLKKLKDRNIRVVVHVILGLPGESKEKMMETCTYLSDKGIDGIKIHLLHILKGTKLYEYVLENPYESFEKKEYIEFVVDILERISPNIVVHRMTGDGKKELLYEPWWSLDKRALLNGIDRELRERDTYQGAKNKDEA